MGRLLLILLFSSSLSLIVGCNVNSPILNVETDRSPIVVTTQSSRVVCSDDISKSNQAFILEILKATHKVRIPLKFNPSLNITITDEQINIMETNTSL